MIHTEGAGSGSAGTGTTLMQTALTHERRQGESQREDEEEDEDPGTFDWYRNNANRIPDISEKRGQSDSCQKRTFEVNSHHSEDEMHNRKYADSDHD